GGAQRALAFQQAFGLSEGWILVQCQLERGLLFAGEFAVKIGFQGDVVDLHMMHPFHGEKKSVIAIRRPAARTGRNPWVYFLIRAAGLVRLGSSSSPCICSMSLARARW